MSCEVWGRQFFCNTADVHFGPHFGSDDEATDVWNELGADPRTFKHDQILAAWGRLLTRNGESVDGTVARIGRHWEMSDRIRNDIRRAFELGGSVTKAGGSPSPDTLEKPQ